MSTDAELDCLRQTLSLALRRKQHAYNVQRHKWEYRRYARAAMNRAYKVKQQAYARQASTWQTLRQLRDEYRPLIGKLNLLQDAAFQSAERAFFIAKKARSSGNSARARDYAIEGRRYKKEARRYARERRSLTTEIRAAKAQHEVARLAFHAAKADFDAWKNAFEAATIMFRQADAVFRAKAEIVKAGNQQLQEYSQAFAVQAGVPPEHQGNVLVAQKPNGYTDIYFGGADEPVGPGHGHYVMNRQGRVIYRRNPHAEHAPKTVGSTT